MGCLVDLLARLSSGHLGCILYNFAHAMCNTPGSSRVQGISSGSY